jgi:predicted secreted protein
MDTARMLKRVLAEVAWLPLGVAVAAFLIGTSTLAQAGTVKVGEKEMGQNVVLGTGDTLEITLDSPSNPALSWQVFQFDSGIVKEVGSPTYAANKSPGGTGGETTLQFTPVAPGSTSIDLRYLPQGASSTAAPSKVYSIIVTVKSQTT